MASGFFALFDDIATLMDDVAVMGKTAAKQTAGVLGDDLAVNANKAAGFASSRELPVLWAISKGSLLNKLLILPVAFLLSAFAPWAIVPILMLGGVYLAYEGAEKIFEWLFHRHHEEPDAEKEPEDPVAEEKKKVRSAIVTDFILSIEIVVIALGTVTGQPILSQIIAVSIVALLATVGVYGIVTLLVRLDDIGLGIIKRSTPDGLGARFGHLLVAALPRIVRFLSIVGVIAMLLVGGGIYIHNIEQLHHLFAHWPMLSGELVVGLVVGMMVLGVEKGVHRVMH